MTLEEFVKAHIKYLQNFEESWKEEHKKNPEMFPMKMGCGDWFEAFELLIPKSKEVKE